MTHALLLHSKAQHDDSSSGFSGRGRSAERGTFTAFVTLVKLPTFLHTVYPIKAQMGSLETNFLNLYFDTFKKDFL